MRLWPFRRRQSSEAQQDMNAALWEADRAIRDAKQLRHRADDVTGRLSETWGRNHFKEAVIDTMMRRRV